MKTEEYTQELNPQEDYEEISQVPLETDRPVGTSHVGTAEGMEKGPGLEENGRSIPEGRRKISDSREGGVLPQGVFRQLLYLWPL